MPGVCTNPCPALTGAPRCNLAQEGEAQQVLEYIDAVDAGVLVRSFAKGDANLNLVLWRWMGGGCALKVVDNQDLLGRM